jgi:DNA-binding transcriptional regulator YiaG
MSKDILLVTSGMNQMLKRPLLVKKTEIGGLIREFRLLTKLTQEQFAAYLGVTYATVNRWENERSQPSPMAMDKIEQKLGEWGEQGKTLLENNTIGKLRG